MIVKTKSSQRGRCRVDAGRKRHAVHHAVSGIPAPAGTHPVSEHRTPKSRPTLDFPAPDQSQAPTALQSEDRSRRRDDPADVVRHPAPTIFRGIEANLRIGRSKFETPEPEGLAGLG